MQYRSVFRAGLFEGQSVVVTGGGSGIGRCTAHERAALGAKVALVGRKPEMLDTVREEIAAACGGATTAGAAATTHACDIRDEEQVCATVDAVLAAHGRIDGLVNNAGGQFPAPLRDISLKGWEAVVRTNLTGGFLMARECYRRWMEANGGAIVNMSADMWGGMPGMAHSGAARAGMVNFTESAACEWAASGVRVNAVAPGWIASSGFETYPPEVQEWAKTLKHKIPLQRFGTESEAAAAIVFLLSEAASFITGTTIRIDGGVLNARPTWPLVPHKRSKAYNGFPLYAPPKFMSEE
jgi:citronellol/citronellal dehydrogenase